MIAKEASLKEIIESEPHLLEIPFFQRRYVWKEENWEELLGALERVGEEKIFWGSVIIKRAKERDPEYHFSKGYIIDGQQRLTTIAILTKAIYDSLDDKAKQDWGKKIVDSDLFFKPYTSAPAEKQQIIIRHSRVDRKEYEYVIRTGISDNKTVEIAEDGGQIMRCYAYFKKMLEQKTQSDVAKLADNLYGDEKVFVQISLDENDVNEQAIFDSINRAGQKLYTSDIIKNNLFKKLVSLTESDDEAGKLCDKYWDNLFWTEEFWDEKRQFGNVGKSHLDFLLYAVACIKWTDEPLQNINDNLESVFEKRTAGYDETQIITLIEEIAIYALIYKKYIYEYSLNWEDISFGAEEHMKRLLLIMDKFKIQMFYPYILKCLFDSKTSVNIEKKEIECNLLDEKMNCEIKVLEAYIVRRKIAGAGTSAYSKKCMDILKNGIKQLYSDYKLGTQEDSLNDESNQIREALKDIRQQEVAKIVLFCLELTRWNDKDDLEKLIYHYQIEHIMPKKWEKYWKRPSSMAEDERDRRIREIGNMILLSQKLNGHLQNREYVVKMEGEHDGKTQKEGYKARTQLKMTKEVIDAYDGGDKVWDEEHIRKRTEKISDEVIAHWNVRKLLGEVVL